MILLENKVDLAILLLLFSEMFCSGIRLSINQFIECKPQKEHAILSLESEMEKANSEVFNIVTQSVM